MKKARLTTIALLVLVICVSMLAVQTRIVFSSQSLINVQSPKYGEIILSVTSGTLNVKFSVDNSLWSGHSVPRAFMGVELYIDGYVKKTWRPPLEGNYYSINVSELVLGMHRLEIKALVEEFHTYTPGPDGPGGIRSEIVVLDTSGPILFTIGPPEISNLSIQNNTYNINQIPLSYNIRSEPGWQLAFVLDGKPIVKVNGNTTLGVLEGSHSIIFYVVDWKGNSLLLKEVFFSVAIPEISASFTPIPQVNLSSVLSQFVDQTAEPTLTASPTSNAMVPVFYLMSLVALGMGIIVIVGLMVYLRKRWCH